MFHRMTLFNSAGTVYFNCRTTSVVYSGNDNNNDDDDNDKYNANYDYNDELFDITLGSNGSNDFYKEEHSKVSGFSVDYKVWDREEDFELSGNYDICE